MAAVAQSMWQVRSEGSAGAGRMVSLSRLARGLVDGDWQERDEVRGPGDSAWRLIGEHPELEQYLPRRPLFKSRPGEEAEMDMTPMIDVTFQLLIFFMIAATYVVQKTLDMPATNAPPGPSRVTLEQLEKTHIVVRIAADGALSVDGQPVELSALVQSLEAALKTKEQAELVLDAADEVDHDTVVQVIDAAGAAEIEKVHFVSRAAAPPRPAPAGNGLN